MQPTPVFLLGESCGQESGGLQSVGSQQVGWDWATKPSTYTDIWPELSLALRPFSNCKCLTLKWVQDSAPHPASHTPTKHTQAHLKVLCYLSILICTVFLFPPLAPESGSSMFLSELLVLLPGILVPSLSRVQLFVTPWTTASQALLSMGFPRQEYWSGLPFLPPGDFPEAGIKLFPSPSLVGGFFTTVPLGKPWECPPLNSWWLSFINLLVKSYLIYNCCVYDIPPRSPLLFSWCCFSTSNVPLLS